MEQPQTGPTAPATTTESSSDSVCLICDDPLGLEPDCSHLDLQAQIGPLIQLLNSWRRPGAPALGTEGDLASTSYCDPCWTDLQEICKILDQLDGIKARVIDKLRTAFARNSSTENFPEQQQRQEFRAQILRKSCPPPIEDNNGADNLIVTQSRGPIRLRPVARELLAPIPKEILAYGLGLSYVELKTENEEGPLPDWEPGFESDPLTLGEYEEPESGPVTQWPPPGRVLTPTGRLRKASGYKPKPKKRKDLARLKALREKQSAHARAARAAAAGGSSEERKISPTSAVQEREDSPATPNSSPSSLRQQETLMDPVAVKPPRRPNPTKPREQPQQEPHHKKKYMHPLVGCWLSSGKPGRRTKKQKASRERLAEILKRKKGRAAATAAAPPAIENPLETSIKAEAPEAAPFQCHKCNQNFLSLLLYSEHRITCFRICSVCAEPTGSTPDLRDHMLTHHNHPDMQYGRGVCNICQKPFARLEHHFVTVHQTEFSCRVCQEEFSTFLDYNHHLRSHPALELPPVRCEEPGCLKLFLSYRRLLRHESNIHRREYEFRCDWPGCGYGTPSSTRLKAHVKSVHHGLKEHQCNICSQFFGSGRLLRTHMDRHEGKQGKIRVCTEPGCGKRFRELGKFKDHQTVVHGIGSSDGGGHIGDTCGKTFPIYNYLYIHLRSHETVEEKRERRVKARRAKEERERRMQAGLPVLAPKGRPRTRPIKAKNGKLGTEHPSTAAEGPAVGNLNQNMNTCVLFIK